MENLFAFSLLISTRSDLPFLSGNHRRNNTKNTTAAQIRGPLLAGVY
tara:strand:- start:578 stop:718 length:141 start_codon:yes stop_codon:yes gene_type:complete